MSRGIFLVAALAFTACPSGNKCVSNADCMTGQVCSVASGTCVAGTGGGMGGGGGGGVTGGGGGTTGGGSGGGAQGGGTGGGSTGGGSGVDGGMQVTGGETCAMAQTITAGTITGTTVGSMNDYTNGCGAENPGPDTVYKISVPAGQRLSLTATPQVDDAGNQFDLSIYLVEGPASNCTTPDGGDSFDCLAGADAVDPTAVERTSYTNNSGSAVDVLVVIDSYFPANEPSTDGGVNIANEGTFTLEATLATPPMGDLCDSALPLALGTPLTNQDLDAYGNDYGAASITCGHTSSPDVAYSVTVPAGEVLVVTVTPNGTFDPALSIAADAAECGMTCLDSVDVGFEGEPEVYRYTNSTGAPQTLYVVVDGYPDAARTFSISATSAPPPMGDRCETAAHLPADMTVNATTIGYSNDYENQAATTTCSSGYIDADRAFTFSVDAGVRAVITVTPAPDAGFNPSINLIEGAASACSAMPRACATGSNGAGTNAAETLRFFNGSGATKTFFAIVDSATAPGNFTINYTTDLPPSDDVCWDTMSTLTNGNVVNSSMAGFTADYTFGVGCPASAGPDRVFRAQLASDEKLSLTVTPTGLDGGFDPVVKFVPGPASACDTTPRTCAGGINFGGRNAPETGAFTNNTGMATTVFVVLADGQAVTQNRDFTLTPAIAAAPMGESCRVPQVLTAGMLLGQTLAGASADVTFGTAAAMTCEASNGRPDRVYSATVPNGQTLTVAVTPATSVNLAVNIVDGPATACASVAACLDSSDTLGASLMPETVSWQNTTGAAKTVFVQVVSSPDTTSAAAIGAAFSLNTTIQ